MDELTDRRLATFLTSLDGIAWFEACGHGETTDFVDAWDAPHRAAWETETRALERRAVPALGESGVDALFDRVTALLDTPVRAAMERYFERRPVATESARIGADRGLWPEWLDCVLRDVSWAAVEAALDEAGFFTDLMPVYRAGRWPYGKDLAF